MRVVSGRAVWVTAVVLAMLGGVTASADSVRIGGLGTGENYFPFGGGAGSGKRYQQVYSSALFGGPMTISEIDFFNNIREPGLRPLSGSTFSIYLSTTSKLVNGLDTVMANNVGGDNALFFLGVLDSTVPFVDAEYKLQLMGTPFTYNPAYGNLLIDIRATGGATSDLFMDAHNGDFGTDSSRMHDYGGGFESVGLVTQFVGPASGDPIPEAGTLASLCTLVGLGGVWLRRRR